MCGIAGRVLDGAALLMRAVAEGGAAAAGPLREAALSEGAMLHHLLAACTAQVGPRRCLRRCRTLSSSAPKHRHLPTRMLPRLIRHP